MVVQIGNNCLLNARRKVYSTPTVGVPLYHNSYKNAIR